MNVIVFNVYRNPVHVSRGQEITADAVLFTRSARLDSIELFIKLLNSLFSYSYHITSI